MFKFRFYLFHRIRVQKLVITKFGPIVSETAGFSPSGERSAGIEIGYTLDASTSFPELPQFDL